MQLDSLLVNLGLTKSNSELVALLIVFALLSLVYWLLVGRFRLHNVLINIYISFSLIHVIPQDWQNFIKNGPAIIFLILIVLLTLLSGTLFEIHLSGPGLVYWQAIIMSFLQVGLVTSIVISLLSKKDVAGYISPGALGYFASPFSILIWMILPLAFLFVLNKKGR